LRKLKPVTAFYIRNWFDAFNSGLIFTALYVYYARTLALTPLQLSLLGALHMLIHVLLEVPTGIVADVVSRKASVLLGSALIGICFVLTGAIPIYGAVLCASLIEAIGDTFVSGALDAWLTDEVGADKVGAIILRSEQLGAPFHWAGVATSVLLATLFNHQVPIVLGGVLWLVATGLLIKLMPETGFVRRASYVQTAFSLRSAVQHMLGTFSDGIRLVRGRNTLLMLFAAQLFIGAFDAGFFLLNRLHLFTNLALPVLHLPWIGALDESAWIAIFDGSNSLLYFLGIAVLRRKVDLSDAHSAPKVLFMLFAGVGVGAITFALSPSFAVAAVALCTLSALHTMTEPLLRTWLNQHITSDVRATVLSMNTQVNRLGMMGGSLGIGALGDVAGLRVALSASALFLLPLLAVLRRTRIFADGATAEHNETISPS
jgi:uncharacterized protein (DUF697 family)